ncbi:MAG TPA: YsnF/AvaK domain-containing protein [Paucimonas sp.]|nr:YsnF/AvaK domain-containing protein [Paucimonas sp.]
MQHTVAAVFDQYQEARSAFDDLIASGFPADDVHLSQEEASESGTTAAGKADEETADDTGTFAFFRRLFGGGDQPSDAALYSEAVRHGNYVLTVDVPDDQLVDRATDVLDRHHPIDIEERAAQWKSGAWAAPESMRQAPVPKTEPQQTKAMPVVEEELKVGKRQVQRGGVRVYQRVTEKPVQESIDLREEHVKVERRPVDEPASEADVSALKDETFEVRETAEEPVVEKQARIVEEVVIGKETIERQQDIQDTVRRSDVEIEQLAGQASDDAFRTHWQSAYGQSGGRYEDYAPAYQYGSTLASSGRFKGRRWDDIESDVRTEWESRHPESAWEKFKAAVRHGWERMTT